MYYIHSMYEYTDGMFGIIQMVSINLVAIGPRITDQRAGISPSSILECSFLTFYIFVPKTRRITAFE